MEILKEFDIVSVKEKFRDIILNESNKDYFKELMSFLQVEYENKNIFPNKEDVFNAFKYLDFDSIKVVIIGQDPYPKKNQAHGLSFSIYNKEDKIPCSLRNILKELKEDLCIECNHGNLTHWAEQGVLLINSFLTVEEGIPNSHKHIGWDKFTDSIIEKLSIEREGLVFILWGNFAKKKSDLIDENKHLIISSPHPSGLSASRGFFNSKPFSRTNNYLKKNGVKEIDWRVV